MNIEQSPTAHHDFSLGIIPGAILGRRLLSILLTAVSSVGYGDLSLTQPASRLAGAVLVVVATAFYAMLMPVMLPAADTEPEDPMDAQKKGA